MGKIHVNNEVGKLKRVLLHRPGNELLNLSPNTLFKYLFEDIPFLDDAIKEHDLFAHALNDNGIEVLYLEDLVTEVFSKNSEAKNKFIKQYINEAGINTIKYKNLVEEYLNGFKDPKELVLKTMEGIKVSDIPKRKREIEKTLNDIINEPDKFIAEPMPNIYYVRDPFTCVGDGVDLNKLRSKNRNRESIYAEYIFKYHPDYLKATLYYNRKQVWYTEGGDLLNLNEHVVLIGVSERTQSEAIDQLAKNYFRDPICKIDTILAFKLPNSRAFMHLDTVLSQVDRYTFIYYPSIVNSLKVYEITEGFDPETFEDLNVREINAPLVEILEKYMNHEVKLIPCALGDKISSEREQWNGGCNILCISPGTVIAYDRNKLTNEALRNEGIKVIEIKSSELSRGRGGPRSMAMPLEREDVDW